MSKIINTLPDKIEQGWMKSYLFYFADGKDIKELPNGSTYTVVYSPSGYGSRWHVTTFRVIRHPTKATTVAQTLHTRILDPREIAYFERMIAQRK